MQWVGILTLPTQDLAEKAANSVRAYASVWPLPPQVRVSVDLVPTVTIRTRGAYTAREDFRQIHALTSILANDLNGRVQWVEQTRAKSAEPLVLEGLVEISPEFSGLRRFLEGASSDNDPGAG